MAKKCDSLFYQTFDRAYNSRNFRATESLFLP